MQSWKKRNGKILTHYFAPFPRRCLREPLPKIVLDILERRKEVAATYQEWLVFSQIEWDILFARARVLMIKRRDQGALVQEFLQTILRWQVAQRVDVVYLNPDGTISETMVRDKTFLAIEFPSIAIS